MFKQKVRSERLEALQKLSSQQKENEEKQIFEKLFTLQEWKNAKVIATTMSQPIEVDTSKVIEAAWNAGKTVVLPRAKKNRVMDFVPYRAETVMELSNFGLHEPAAFLDPLHKNDIDLVLVPGLAFSRNGYRIGFGGGYYDRFLADYRGTTLSLVLAEQLIEEWEPDSFDIPVNFLVTAEEVIFTGK